MDTAFIAGLIESSWTPVLADAGVKGIVLLAIAALAARAMRRSSAAARHLVWMLALMGLLVLPVVSLVAPQWQLPLLPTLPARPAAGVPLVVAVSETPMASAIPQTGSPRLEAGPSPARQPAPTPIAAQPAPRAPEPEAATPPLPLPSILLGLWLAVALALLAPLVLGHAALLRARRRSETYPHAGLQALKGNLGHTLGLRALVVLLRAARGAMPMAAGLVRPAVFLPEEAQTWPEARQRAVLLHELAHVKRRDCLTHALARVAVALHWFNPLAWYALRQLRIEREHACDDLVLAAGERPSDYAENLLEIARTLRAGRLTAAAGITMAKRSHLEGRLIAILDAARNRGLLTWKFVVVAVLGASGTAAVLGGATLAREISSTDDLRDMAAPVKETSLEGFFGGWRNLPFQLSTEEEADVNRCVALAESHRQIKNGVNQFTVPAVREQLEQLLTRRPDYFYAEYLLGMWHQMHGDSDRANPYFLQSYRHAPVVLVQRYEDSEQRPVTGAKIQSIELECNRVLDGSLDPSLRLLYFDRVTNSDGAIYLPAYDTVFRTNAISYPEDLEVNYPALGWFRSRGKVGLMPTARAGIIGSAYEQAAASDENGAVQVGGRNFRMENVWRMNAQQAMQPFDPGGVYCDGAQKRRYPELAEGEWDCLLVDIGGEGRYPKFFDVVEIRVFDHESRKLLWDSDWRNSPDGSNGKIIGGFSNALMNTIFLARRGEEWPESIDLWLRIDLLAESSKSNHWLPVAGDFSIVSGSGSVGIEEIRAGSWNCSYSEGGGTVQWNELNPGTENSECSVVLRRSGDWDGGRMNVRAIDIQGNTHWPQSLHFLDFKRTALQVVLFPIPPDQLHELRLGVLENELDFRKSFYFDGIDITTAGPTLTPEATPETTAANTGQSVPSYLLGAWEAPGKNVVIARKSFNLRLALQFQEDGSISGTLGAADLETARLAPWSPDDTARYQEEFDHKLEATIRGPLGDTLYDGHIVIGLVDNGDHWLARSFLNLSGMGTGGDEWVPLSAYLMQPQVSPIAGSIPNANLVVYNGPRGSGSSCESGIGNFGIGRTSTVTCGYPGAVSVVTCTGLGRDGAGWRFAFTRTFPSDGPSPETTTNEVVYTGGALAIFEDEYQWIGFEENDETPPPPEGRVDDTIPAGGEAAQSKNLDYLNSLEESELMPAPRVSTRSQKTYPGIGESLDATAPNPSGASENSSSPMPDRLAEFLDGSQRRCDAFLKAGIKIEFTQRIRNRADDPNIEDIYYGTLWMRDGDIVVELRDDRGRTGNWYEVDGLTVIDAPQWNGYGGHIVLPGNDSDAAATGQRIGYPARLALPGNLLAHQWRLPGSKGQRYILARLENGFLEEGPCDRKLDCISAGTENGIDYISVNAGGSRTDVAPEMGYALLWADDTAYSEFIPLDSGFWFPQRAKKQVGPNLVFDGSVFTYYEALEVTDVTLSPAYPEGLFTLPEPENGTLVTVDYPSWRREWEEDKPVTRQWIQGALNSELSFTFGPDMTEEEKDIFEVSKFWRERASDAWGASRNVNEALNAGTAIPFYDRKAEKIVWATLDEAAERLRIAQHGSVKSPQHPARSRENSQSNVPPLDIEKFLASLNPGALPATGTESRRHRSIIRDTSDWGEAVNGLQAAFRLRTDTGDYTSGEAIGLEYLVRNAGDSPIEFLTSSWRNGDPCDVFDAAGNKVIGGGVSLYSGLNEVRRIRLLPGEMDKISSASFAFVPKTSNEVPGHPVGTWIGAGPGTYSVRFRVHFPDSSMSSGEGAQREGDWTGDLTTGALSVSVVEPENENETTAEGHVWGETVDGLQAALVLSPPGDAFALGEPIQSDIRLRNVSGKDIEFTALNTALPGEIIVRDSAGIRIATGSNRILDISSGLNRYVIGPGEMATIGHPDITFVAEEQPASSAWNRIAITPGAYTVQVTASIGPFAELGFVGVDGKTLEARPEDWTGTLTTGAVPIVVRDTEDTAQQSGASVEADPEPFPGVHLEIHPQPFGTARPAIVPFGPEAGSYDSGPYGAEAAFAWDYVGHQAEGWHFRFARTNPSPEAPGDNASTQDVVYNGGNMTLFRDERWWIGIVDPNRERRPAEAPELPLPDVTLFADPYYAEGAPVTLRIAMHNWDYLASIGFLHIVCDGQEFTSPWGGNRLITGNASHFIPSTIDLNLDGIPAANTPFPWEIPGKHRIAALLNMRATPHPTSIDFLQIEPISYTEVATNEVVFDVVAQVPPDHFKPVYEEGWDALLQEAFAGARYVQWDSAKLDDFHVKLNWRATLPFNLAFEVAIEKERSQATESYPLGAMTLPANTTATEKRPAQANFHEIESTGGLLRALAEQRVRFVLTPSAEAAQRDPEVQTFYGKPFTTPWMRLKPDLLNVKSLLGQSGVDNTTEYGRTGGRILIEDLGIALAAVADGGGIALLEGSTSRLFAMPHTMDALDAMEFVQRAPEYLRANSTLKIEIPPDELTYVAVESAPGHDNLLLIDTDAIGNRQVLRWVIPPLSALPFSAARVDELLAACGRDAGGFIEHMTLQTYDTDLTRELVQIGRPAVPQLIAALEDPNKHLRRQAAHVLGKIGDPQAVEPLLACCRAEHARNAESGKWDNDVLEPATIAIGRLLRPEIAHDRDQIFWATGALNALTSGGYLFEWDRDPELESFWANYREQYPTVYTALEDLEEEFRVSVKQSAWDGLPEDFRLALERQRQWNPAHAPYIPMDAIARTASNFHNEYADASAWWRVADQFLTPDQRQAFHSRKQALIDAIAACGTTVVPELLPTAYPQPEEYPRHEYAREVLRQIGKDALPVLLSAWEHPERHSRNALLTLMEVVDPGEAKRLSTPLTFPAEARR